MDLRHFRYFSALADEGSFKRAADRLGITESELSQQIRELERELGFLLFYRGRSGATLTQSGQDFLPVVRDLLEHTDRVSSFAHSLSELIPQNLVIAYARSSGLGLSTRLVESFSAAHPDIRITTSVGPPAASVEQVTRHEADVAFFRPPLLDRTHIQSLIVAHEPAVAATPQSHPLAADPEVPLTVPLAIAWRLDNVNPALSTFLMFASQYETD